MTTRYGRMTSLLAKLLVTPPLASQHCTPPTNAPNPTHLGLAAIPDPFVCPNFVGLGSFPWLAAAVQTQYLCLGIIIGTTYGSIYYFKTVPIMFDDIA